jgi:hypothetical protein
MVENLQIYKDASELIKRVFIIVKQFPRDYKYTIGTRIQNTALDAVDLIYRTSRHKNCYNLRKSIALRNNLNMVQYEKLALKTL